MDAGGKEKFEYFMERTEQDLRHIRERVDRLWDWRLVMIGGSVSLGGLGGFLVHLLFAYLELKRGG